MTWKEYETELKTRLANLHSRVHLGTYRAQPLKRAYIPKADGQERPLDIAALGDKIVQQARAKVLNQIYEEEFLGFSYGFRPDKTRLIEFGRHASENRKRRGDDKPETFDFLRFTHM